MLETRPTEPREVVWSKDALGPAPVTSTKHRASSGPTPAARPVQFLFFSHHARLFCVALYLVQRVKTTLVSGCTVSDRLVLGCSSPRLRRSRLSGSKYVSYSPCLDQQLLILELCVGVREDLFRERHWLWPSTYLSCQRCARAGELTCCAVERGRRPDRRLQLSQGPAREHHAQNLGCCGPTQVPLNVGALLQRRRCYRVRALPVRASSR
jgi:hypothetical protein